MRKLCIVVLDVSQSMNDVVELEGPRAGELVGGFPPTKLEIAKRWLLRALHVVDLDMLVVVAAGDESSTVYRSGRTDLNALTDVFGKISPSCGGVNLDATSESVREILEGVPGRRVSIVFITDGQTVSESVDEVMKCKSDDIQLTTIVVAPAYGSFNVKKRHEGPSKVFAVRSALAFESIFHYATCAHDGVADGMALGLPATASAAKSSHTVLGLIAVLAAIVGLTAAVAGYFTTLIDKPSTAIPIAGASLCLIAASVLFYVFFAQEVSAAGLFRSARDPYPYYPKVHRYKTNIRVVALLAGIVCVISSGVLLTYALVTNNKEPHIEQKTLQNRSRPVR